MDSFFSFLKENDEKTTVPHYFSKRACEKIFEAYNVKQENNKVNLIDAFIDTKLNGDLALVFIYECIYKPYKIYRVEIIRNENLYIINHSSFGSFKVDVSSNYYNIISGSLKKENYQDTISGKYF